MRQLPIIKRLHRAGCAILNSISDFSALSRLLRLLLGALYPFRSFVCRQLPIAVSDLCDCVDTAALAIMVLILQDGRSRRREQPANANVNNAL